MSIKRIKRSKQGDLDGACGFYAVVNAIRSLEPELEPSELFTQTIKAHVTDGNPMSFVNGTFRGSIKNVLSRVIDYLHESYEFTDNITKEPYKFSVKLPYWFIDKERSRNDVITVLKSADYKAGSVCIIGYSYNSGIDGEESYAHWSVVRKTTSEGLELIDSSYEKKMILFDEVRVDSTKQQQHSTRPYNLYSGDIFLISRVPS